MTPAYDGSGSGPPLLLIHGLGGGGRYWDTLVPRLTDDYDVIVVDLPGFGRSGDAALALYDSFSGARGFEPVLRGVAGTPFTEAALLTVPVTVVFEAKDRVILSGDRNRERLPAQTRWIELEGASHNIPWERPSDIIRAIAETTGSAETGVGR